MPDRPGPVWLFSRAFLPGRIATPGARRQEAMPLDSRQARLLERAPAGGRPGLALNRVRGHDRRAILGPAARTGAGPTERLARGCRDLFAQTRPRHTRPGRERSARSPPRTPSAVLPSLRPNLPSALGPAGRDRRVVRRAPRRRCCHLFAQTALGTLSPAGRDQRVVRRAPPRRCCHLFAQTALGALRALLEFGGQFADVGGRPSLPAGAYFGSQSLVIWSRL